MKKQIAVIDYGMGNLHSVASALMCIDDKLDVRVTGDARQIAEADHVIFPGVGAIGDCMAEIRRLNVDAVVADTIDSGKPLLAICVGMQALMQRSDENQGVDCLGYFPGEVKFFADNAQFKQNNQAARVSEKMKVPHMGWNNLEQTIEHPLWHNIDNAARFYFVHSYYVDTQPECVAGTCEYGLCFSAALAKRSVFATQFHPEKSHQSGLQLLKNFIQWNGTC
ncbi:MAG: imidazole glycerol phosphate synthase subunit HisH [Cellvibrionaceae bacterium]|nr:imidazole glycerol phosphate synthase subunit HisH [Cellvibrionaceae bacterium]